MPKAFDSLTFENLKRALQTNGVESLYYKQLASNDNSKNQVYLGGDLSVLNVLPSGELLQTVSSSGKPGAVGKEILKAALQMFWMDSDGTAVPAPKAQLILYPQYPEVRLSGFLSGSAINLGEWFDSSKRGRASGRVFIFGVAKDGRVYGHLALPNSSLGRNILSLPSIGTFGALTQVSLARADDGLAELCTQLKRINALGWIESKRLDSARNVCTCNSPNCGGYTLEAELGITPNGLAEPDFRGWEIKTFGVENFSKVEAKVITLMTPEPDGGIYKDRGVDVFLRRFGYPDTAGRGDRINFGGIYAAEKLHPTTKLKLTLMGYDSASGKIRDVNGGIALMAGAECAALWTYRKLIDHWKKKHDKAAYVPNMGRIGPPRCYHYDNSILLGRGTDFQNLLQALTDGKVYYDPGIKMENASTARPIIKRRSQFRIKARSLGGLYKDFKKLTI